MDAKTRTKLVNTLMSKFIQQYHDKYGVNPKFNRNTERWGFGYYLDDLGPHAFDILEYYFSLNRRHSSADFMSNYHNLLDWWLEDSQDAIHRRALAEETKKRVEEFRRQWRQQP